jgi:hypothetical protein
VVVCSIVLHGPTDTPGSEWMARRAERDGEDADTRHSEDGGADAPARRSTPVTP